MQIRSHRNPHQFNLRKGRSSGHFIRKNVNDEKLNDRLTRVQSEVPEGHSTKVRVFYPT